MTYLINAVAQALQLLHASSCLFVRIIPRANGAHARRFVSRVALGTVIKIGVGTTRAVTTATSATPE